MRADQGAIGVVVLLDGEVERIIARLRTDRADLSLVDALARMQLAARRLGCGIELRGPASALHELVELVGLTDVVRATPEESDEADG